MEQAAQQPFDRAARSAPQNYSQNPSFTLSVGQADEVIGQALQAGRIDRETAGRAIAAMRGGYYGNRMTGRDRARILEYRFGILDADEAPSPISSFPQPVALEAQP